MTKRTRPALLAAVLLAVTAVPLSAPAAADDRAVRNWASDVWEAARSGNAERLDESFGALPADQQASPSATRFRTSLDQLRSHRIEAEKQRQEQREAALVEMREELEASHLAKALRKAVEAQTFSDDLDSVFDDEEIMRHVRWADEQIGVAEAQRQWLDAQELVYLLRTFYDDTDRRWAFEKYDEQLKRINRRVALLAQYVPRRLHEMRSKRALRDGDEPLGDFNPATAVDWRERLEDVNVRTLRQALQTASNEHIEVSGWRPLLTGGLESLKLVATTPSLAETFPGLDNEVAVRRWTREIDDRLEGLARIDDEDLDRWTLNDLLDDLARINQDTIRLPQEVIVREFGDGALDRLDPYSEIIWPDQLRRFQQATAGNFVGVGILIRHDDKRDIMVVNPLEGTPAYFAGVKPNDLIVKVDGDSTVGWSLNDAVDRITGPKGTIVHLGLKREGEAELVDVPITRDRIKIRSVKGWWKKDLQQDGEPVWDWFIDPATRVAYIRLTQFTEDSFADLRQAWREINVGGAPSGLVLDLRHNPGGLLTSAVQISNLFVNEGNIVTGEDKDGNRAWGQQARRNLAEFAGVPTVVLINRGSASASEIVAGCLQAHNAALIVGDRSFGKGSVQTIHHVAPNGRLKLTTQYYRLPSPDGGLTKGRLVHKRSGAEVWGVDPDIEVEMSVSQVRDAITLRQEAEMIPLDEDGRLDPTDPERPDVNTLLTDGIDPQLATALLLLQAQAMATEDVRLSRREGASMRTP